MTGGRPQLSASAAELLAELSARVGSEAPVHEWLTAVLESPRGAAAVATAGGDPAALGAGRPEGGGDPGPVLRRDELAGRATQRATDEGRPVAAMADLVAVVIDAATAPTRPLAMEPSRPRPADPAAPRAAGTDVTALTIGSQGPTAPARPLPAAPEPRVIRVFVSSTFRDMAAERDELAKRVFPQLRRICEARDVTWGEVDLRWGITDEQKAEGRVLPICLAEIAQCRPFFIGLLGERYGWVPETMDATLLEDEPWIAQHPGASVTELEFLHGALNDVPTALHSFFYLRSPQFLERLDADERARFVEAVAAEEIATYGADEAERRAAERRRRLEELKARIRASGLPVVEDYADPEDLGRLVLADLTAAIDARFPAGSRLDPLDRAAAEHDVFARSRARVYVGREDDFRRLDEHAAGVGPPLAVLGESGSGKSALLANWALRHQAANPGDVVLTHFVGATAESAEWSAMLRRLIGELARRVGITVEVPDDADGLRRAFASTLYRAATHGRFVLVLDALDQLADREGAPDLVWLPPDLPPEIRLVVATLPGRPLDAIRERGWPTLAVRPLTRDERVRLIADYLAPRTLSAARVERLADAPQTASPLYLRALLEELRVWGEHFLLDERIDHYLAAPTIAGLYGKILERYEDDYERDRPGLVGDAFSLLWAGRHGLSEAELLDLLGRDGAPLPRAVWAPLALVAEQSLVDHSGLLGFSHRYFADAVHNRYLPDAGSERAVHTRLARYFAGQPLGRRRVSEQPWQLARAGDWRGLRDLLADPELLDSAWRNDAVDVKSRWAEVEAASSHRIADAYRPVVDDPARFDDDVLFCVERLLSETGHTEEAMVILRAEEARARDLGSPGRLQGILANQGVELFARGDLDAAMARYREQEEICRRLGDEDGVATSRANQANVLFRRGDLDGAMALHLEEERRCREQHDQLALQRCLGNQALVLFEQHDLDGAMARHEEEERICRELGDPDQLQGSLGNQALVLRARGDLPGALDRLEEKERICRRLGNRPGLGRALGNRAEVLRDLGRLDEAARVNAEAMRLAREVGDRPDLALALQSRAAILREQGDGAGARAANEETVDVLRALGDRRGLERALGQSAMLLDEAGDLDRALDVRRELLLLCRELDDADRLVAALNDLAVALKRRGAYADALPLLEEAEQICRAQGDRSGIARFLLNQGLAFSHQGDAARAITLLEESERIYREIDDMQGVATALVDQAAARSRDGRPEEAQASLRAAHRVAVEHGLTDLVAVIEPQLDPGLAGGVGSAADAPPTGGVGAVAGGSPTGAAGAVAGLSEPSRLDVVMKNPAGDLVLGIFATGDWSADPRLAAALQAKLDAYVGFANSQQCTAQFGSAPRRILVLSDHEPTPEIAEVIRRTASSSGLPIDFERSPAGP